MSETTTPSPPPPAGGGRHSFGERVMGALRLDASIYDEIEHDPDALGQAAGVVALAAVASAIGVAGGAMGDRGVGVILGGVVAAFLGWLISAGIVWVIGVRIMEHTSDYPELLRTLGFAQAPQLLKVLALVPLLGFVVWIAVFFWGLAAYVVAVRQALDVETGRAIVVCVLAWGSAVLLALVFGLLAGSCSAGGHAMMG